MNHMPSEEMRGVFASTKLKLHSNDYWIVSLPVKEQEKVLELFKTLMPFNSVIIDFKEVSLILAADDWNSMKSRFNNYQEEGPYKAITFDIILDLSLVGYLSVVLAILADAGISIYALSSYLRDHILIKVDDAERAMKLLDDLIQRCQKS